MWNEKHMGEKTAPVSLGRSAPCSAAVKWVWHGSNGNE